LLGCAVFVAFTPLSFVVNVDSFFFGVIITSVGVQHVCVGARVMMLLLAKAASPPSSALLRFVVDFGGRLLRRSSFRSRDHCLTRRRALRVVRISSCYRSFLEDMNAILRGFGADRLRWLGGGDRHQKFNLF
jgi:hypothetical protein